jgi:hypothetical protein
MMTGLSPALAQHLTQVESAAVGQRDVEQYQVRHERLAEAQSIVG